MCIGLPMKVIECQFGFALCDYRGEQREIDMRLVGDQPKDTWVLVFIDAARDVLREDEAVKIENALTALELALKGESNFDHLFADLVEEQPTSVISQTAPSQDENELTHDQQGQTHSATNNNEQIRS